MKTAALCRTGAVVAILAGTSACIPTADSALAEKARQMPVCDQLQALIAGHADGFARLRGEYRNTRYTDIWSARYDMIGKGCEIWRTGTGSTHYVCTRTAPDRDTADVYYSESLATARSCLGPDWNEKETPRKLGTGVKTVFSRPADKTTVAIHEIQTDGIFKKQWTLYYFVGETNDQL